MRWCFIIFILTLAPGLCRAAPAAAPREVTMSAEQAIQMADDMVDAGDYVQAEKMLIGIPPMGNGPLEMERWFLIAQIAQKRGDFDTATKIYHKILAAQPNLARVRFELALCYMQQKKWRRADYHMRLAMAGRDLPDDARAAMNYYRYMIRKNKNWNVWFNFGAAPDNNINNAAGGQECVATIFGLMCRDLGKPESAVGANLTLGGNYEFKLSEQWRWKSDGNIYLNAYDKNDYDDLYITAGTGPRYVWTRGDIWVAAVGARRWYGWEKYNKSAGAKIDTNYDFTRKLSGGLYLRFMNNKYDRFSDFLDSQTYSAAVRATYSFNASVYMMLRGTITRERAENDTYSYWQPGGGIGLGAEMPWGFHVYLEPSFYHTRYDAPRWTVKHDTFKEVKERNFTSRYAISVSNNKINIWGFIPTLTVSYTRRDSNIWQREFDKTTLEFTMQQRF